MQVLEVLEQGISDGDHVGAQAYVSHHGEVVVDAAVGEARAGVPMTTATLMNWFSMTKAITAIAVAQQWQAGVIDVDAPAATYVPEFGAAGKDGITLRHLLTHTAGIGNADGMLQGQPWRESNGASLERIYAAPPAYPAGTRAGYHPAAGMTVLGEIVAARVGRSVRGVRTRPDLRTRRSPRLLGRDARGALRRIRRPHGPSARHHGGGRAPATEALDARGRPRRCPVRVVSGR